MEGLLAPGKQEQPKQQKSSKQQQTMVPKPRERHVGFGIADNRRRRSPSLRTPTEDRWLGIGVRPATSPSLVRTERCHLHHSHGRCGLVPQSQGTRSFHRGPAGTPPPGLWLPTTAATDRRDHRYGPARTGKLEDGGRRGKGGSVAAENPDDSGIVWWRYRWRFRGERWFARKHEHGGFSRDEAKHDRLHHGDPGVGRRRPGRQGGRAPAGNVPRIRRHRERRRQQHHHQRRQRQPGRQALPVDLQYRLGGLVAVEGSLLGDPCRGSRPHHGVPVVDTIAGEQWRKEKPRGQSRGRNDNRKRNEQSRCC
mmetsp:Transcript_7026/g.14328  ORF Transcript_7026/g.14328 Transcript_7026/m.14328 type:complete len:309 (-) Transcript_7026:2162-3088(-)